MKEKEMNKKSEMYNIRESVLDVIYHLSDKDFDGYSSQYFVNTYLSLYRPGVKINFETAEPNSVKLKLNEIFDSILKDKSKSVLIIITDISLNEELEKKLNNFRRGNTNIDINYQLIDHHISGELISFRNTWYHYDISRCAGKLTYEWLELNFGKIDLCYYVSNLVNSHDMWIEDSVYFHLGNYLAELIFTEIKYPVFLESYKREHIFFIIENISKHLIGGRSLFEIEQLITLINFSYLESKMLDREFLLDINISLKHKMYRYFSELMSEVKYKDIEFKGLKINVIFNLGSEFQYLSKDFLKRNIDVDILINLKQNKKIAMRTIKEDINLGELCSTFFNGGGHKKAAGGYLPNEICHSQEEAENIIFKILK